MAARLFSELGYLNVQTPYKLKGVRTTKEVDVYAEDHFAGPPLRIACECKHWESAVPQGVVLEFRSVLEDAGINRGFLVSKAGFQSGARDAALSTPIVLADFTQFQKLFFTAWVATMSRRLDRSARLLAEFHPLASYDIEPNLPKNKLPVLLDLQRKYNALFSLLPGMSILQVYDVPVSCAIIAREPSYWERWTNLGIRTYRQFFERQLAMVDQALGEFRVLFGTASKPISTHQDT